MITADLVARAIIASAMSMEMDPVIACTTRANPLRAPLAPAAFAVSEVTGFDLDRLASIVGISPNTVKAQTAYPTPKFTRAKRCAEDAVRYALRSAALAGRPKVFTPVEHDEPVLVARAAPSATPCDPPRPSPPPIAPAYRRPDPLAEIGTAGRILAEIRQRPLSSVSLASILGEKDLVVIASLTDLKRAGKVTSEPSPDGARHSKWSVAA